MSEVQRWNRYFDNRGDYMKLETSGEWVRYSDYALLNAYFRKLEEQVPVLNDQTTTLAQERDAATAEVKRLGDELTYLRSVDWPALVDVQEAVLSKLGINEKLRALGDELERYKDALKKICEFPALIDEAIDRLLKQGLIATADYVRDIVRSARATLAPQDEATRIAERQVIAEGLDEAQR